MKKPEQLEQPILTFAKDPYKYATEDERRYAVIHCRKGLIGYVWRIRKHSYRGTEGWNRGLRCRDFQPIRWGYSLSEERPRYHTSYSRQWAAECLLREFDEATQAPRRAEGCGVMKSKPFDPEHPDLCEHCQMPRIIHIGFNHRECKCIVASGWIAMKLRGMTDSEAKATVNAVNAWLERQDESAARIGEGI